MTFFPFGNGLTECCSELLKEEEIEYLKSIYTALPSARANQGERACVSRQKHCQVQVSEEDLEIFLETSKIRGPCSLTILYSTVLKTHKT